ncbi:RecQ-mediated genome instability protein [Parasponia andersonii]|uniref:RecQ-mediated genome instability protein n=1 Tax=Parasponia andersonii TaxID=3476 RepID=A0A2P5CBP0_PARAD|nr:RecQ-mediated genome instability protein [Parasponia andersonii]
MNYSLAALKVLCEQLKEAREMASQTQKAMSLGGILFQRVWLQGILVCVEEEKNHFILDDGTGLIQLSLSASADARLLRSWTLGMYIMVVGAFLLPTSTSTSTHHHLPIVKVHKMVDLSGFPDREAMWYLEVIESYKLFYQPLIDDFV